MSLPTLNNLIHRVYRQLPPGARSAAAGMRGAYLKAWRYGSRTEALTEAAIVRDRWSAAQWKTWQENRLARILHRAATDVPYYRSLWAERRAKGDRASWDYLENWPLLSKQTLRANPGAFLASDRQKRTMFREYTSGTTGTSIDVWCSRATLQKWYSLTEARSRYWYGVSRHDRWAILGGQLVVPAARTKPPYWVWNQSLNQLYLSLAHLAPNTIDDYLDALQRYNVKYLWGYSSALNTLAQGALQIGRHDVSMSVAITNAEPLFGYQRAAISKAFHCPVRETYGMAEMVAAASGCENGNMHMWPEVGYVEFADDEAVIPGSSSGELICTGLLNFDMPLIRYRVGDRAQLAPPGETCSCGRTLPLLKGLQGRQNDVLVGRDGRRIYWLNPVFYGLPIHEAQVIQQTADLIKVLYVAAPGFNTGHAAAVRDRLRERVGDMQIILEQVPFVPRTTSGKFRAVVSLLPDAHQSQTSISSQPSEKVT